MGFQCVQCRRPLYNRRRKTCEFCGAAVPERLRLSPRQVAAIERLKAEEAKQHKEFMDRELPGDGMDLGGGGLIS